MTNLEFIRILKRWQFLTFVGVPCSWISSLIIEIERDNEITFVPAVREDLAVGWICLRSSTWPSKCCGSYAKFLVGIFAKRAYIPRLSLQFAYSFSNYLARYAKFRYSRA